MDLILDVSMEEIIQSFQQFYKDTGIRYASQLINLTKVEANGFSFPRLSRLHYAIRGTGNIAISQDDPLLTNAGNRIVIDGVSEYIGDNVGLVRKTMRPVDRMLVKYTQKNKRLLTVKESPGLLGMSQILQVICYQPLEFNYLYPERTGSELHNMINHWRTVFESVNIRAGSDRGNHFILMEVPSVIPPRSRLDEAAGYWEAHFDDELPLDNKHIGRFNTDERFLILQLWLWLGSNRELSLFSMIHQSVLDRVNLLFSVDDKVVILNLGLFNSWIKTEENPNGKFVEDKAKLTLLRFYISLQQISTVSSDVIIVDEGAMDDLEEKEKEGTKSALTATEVATKLNKENENNLETVKDLDIDATGYTEKPLNISIKSKPKTKDKSPKGSKDVAEQKLDDTDDSELNEVMAVEVDRDIDQLEIMEAQREADAMDVDRTYVPYKPKEFSHEGKINELSNSLANAGLMSAAEVRRMKNLGEKYKTLPSPFDESQTLEEFTKIDTRALDIPKDNKLISRDLPEVMDKSLLNSSLKGFHERYIKSYMTKHIMASVLHAQQAGIAVTDVSCEPEHTYLGSAYKLRVQLTPVRGAPTTVEFKFTAPDKDGIMRANGVDYKLRLQRVDLPIRKVKIDQVALTSNVSKMFVNRSSTMAFSYDRWLIRQINLLSLNDESKVHEVLYSNVFDQTITVPRSYSIIAHEISSFKYGVATLHFDINKIEKNFPADILKHVDRTKYIPISYQITKGKTLIMVMGMDDKVSILYVEDKKTVPVGEIYRFIGIETDPPMNYTEVKVRGVEIPLAVLLGYRIGLGNLLKTLGCSVTRMPARSRYFVKGDEYALRFEDEMLVLNKNDREAALILAGFNRLKNTIKNISVYQLDKPDVYTRLISVLGASPTHTRTYDLLFDAWIDPITRSLLEEMKEPTDLVLLYLSANRKLNDDMYKDPNGIEGSFLRGYQRIGALLTNELFTAIRQYNNAPMSKTNRVEINPNALWFSIIQDQTVTPIEVSNPVHSIKENSIVVYRGQGGRSSLSMTAAHRQFAKDSIGITSEANIDSGDVGTVTYLTADPNVTSLLGINEPMDINEDTPAAKVESLAMAISPGSDRDDPKRVGFTSVMLTSATFLDNAVPNRLQTSGERTVSLRTDRKWVRLAQMSGTVRSIDKGIITVEYANDVIENIPIGRTFGTWGGTTLPHDMVTNVKVGQVFGKDDVLAYNDNYFQPDSIDPRQVIFKRSVMANMMFFDGRESFEDASSISANFAGRLGTKITHKRHVKIPFDHDIEMLVKKGDTVDRETPVCNIMPPISGIGGSYKGDSRSALDVVNMLQPKASNNGYIDKIEIMYTGDVENMSPALQEMVVKHDAEIYRRNKAVGSPVKSAYIDPSYRIDNVDVGSDQVVLRIYITEHIGASVGDKFVYGNQMKSIVSRVVDKANVTTDGTEVDAVFGRQGISNRIVNSMDIIGSSNKVIELIEQKMIKLYLDNKK